MVGPRPLEASILVRIQVRQSRKIRSQARSSRDESRVMILRGSRGER